MSTAKEILSRLGLLSAARTARRRTRRTVARTLHPVREAAVRLPNPLFLATQPPLAGIYRHHLHELRRDGITRLSGEVAPQALAELKEGFEAFVSRLVAGGRSAATFDGDVTVTDEYFDPQGGQYSSNEPFVISRTLLDVCLKPQLLSLINAYLGKRAYITQGVALRIEPHQNTGYGSFQWHHDAWGKRINMMIVLTEVGPGDQHMTYAKGSHLLRHSYDKYVNSRFSKEEFAERCASMEVLNCYAQPGDLYIFDSNGIHSGNRTSGRARDTFIMEYTRLRHAVWAHRIPPEFLQGFNPEQLEPLAWILHEDRGKRSLAPPLNSWVEGLLQLHKWSI